MTRMTFAVPSDLEGTFGLFFQFTFMNPPGAGLNPNQQAFLCNGPTKGPLTCKVL